MENNYKVIYCVASNVSDGYIAQLKTSILSLRLYNPDMYVIVAMDNDTYNKVSRDIQLNNLANELLNVNVPDEFNNNTLKSRYLKVNVRNFTKGDLLYIDTDTIICGKLEIPSIDKQMAGVHNEHHKKYYFLYEEIFLCFRMIGYKERLAENYFNSGVMFMKDTDDVYKLYNLYYDYWKKMISRSVGKYYDQPALYMANKKLDIISELPSEYNCQVWAHLHEPYIEDCRIIHVYGSVTCINDYYFNVLIKKVKDTGILTNDDIINFKQYLNER